MNESITPEEIIAGVGTPEEHAAQPDFDEPTNMTVIYPQFEEYKLADANIDKSSLTPQEVEAAMKKVNSTE